MSTPFLTFRCKGCDYCQTSFVAVGRFVWVHDSKLFNFYPKIGVCSDCTEIVAIEGIPDPAVFKRAQALHPSLKGNISVVLKNEPAKWLAYQEHFDLLEQIMMQERSPVCLKCGGVNHQEIKFPEVREGERLTDITETPLGIIHPVCGGELYVVGSGCMRLGVTPKTHYFDLRGKYLTTLHGRDGHISF